MKLPAIKRATFTVGQQSPHWVVAQDGGERDEFKTRDEAMAFATRSANASQNAGFPAQIRFDDGTSVL